MSRSPNGAGPPDSLSVNDRQEPVKRGTTRAYYERPPPTARAARAAWDYFSAKYPKRGLKELFYSRHYDLNAGAHWVCSLNMRDSDLDHWAFSAEDLMHAVSCDRLSRELDR